MNTLIIYNVSADAVELGSVYVEAIADIDVGISGFSCGTLYTDESLRCLSSSSSPTLMTSRDMPQEFYCPRSRRVMTDPVICADGHTFEREAITQWLANHNTNPVTGLPLRNTNLIPNLALRSMIQNFQNRIDL
jgi:hypothetical protein